MRLSLVLTIFFLSGCISSNDSNETIKLVINEFMTSNELESITDEYGEPEDWIELFNSGGASLDLSGLYLSDDSTNLKKYDLSGILMQPGEFLLIWADDDPEQGKYHAPFKLSTQNGEEIILSNGSNFIDRIQFFPHNNNPEARIPNKSYGRESDGDPLWILQAEPTPKSANIGITP